MKTRRCSPRTSVSSQNAARPTGGDAERAVVHGELDLLERRHAPLAGERDDLDVRARLPESRPEGEAAAAVGVRDLRDRVELELGSATLERLVHGRPQLLAGDDVHDRRREHDRERDPERRRERDARAEAHVLERPDHDSRSAYPTPRTVWISLPAPPASVLRRRYPM